jgi:hypothetical protein
MPENASGWGSDVPVSMPVPIDDQDIVLDMGTHAFTPDGLRVWMSKAVREEIVTNAYTPVDGGDE